MKQEIHFSKLSLVMNEIGPFYLILTKEKFSSKSSTKNNVLKLVPDPLLCLKDSL